MHRVSRSRLFSKVSVQSIRNGLYGMNWNDMLNQDDVDEWYIRFLDKIANCINANARKTLVTMRNYTKKWLTEEIRMMSQVK